MNKKVFTKAKTIFEIGLYPPQRKNFSKYFGSNTRHNNILSFHLLEMSQYEKFGSSDGFTESWECGKLLNEGDPKYTIYGLNFPNAIYIGYTSKTLAERLDEHDKSPIGKGGVSFVKDHGGIESANVCYLDYAYTETEALYKENWLTVALKELYNNPVKGFGADENIEIHGGIWFQFAISAKKHSKYSERDWRDFFWEGHNTIVYVDCLMDDYDHKGLFGVKQ